MGTILGTTHAESAGEVRGRITQRHLPEADRSIPGIARYYVQLEQKPATFLDLLWKFEGARQIARPRKRRGR